MQQHNTERLQRHISTYSLLAILLVGGIISAVGIWFYANALKQNQQFDLQRELHLRQHAVRRGLERMRDIAIQISSRSRARQVLEGYNNNRVSLDELVSVSRPILADAMRNTADVAGILRLDVGGKQAVNIGTKISDDAQALAAVHTKQAEILDIKILNDRFYLRVISPIRNRSGQRVGTDVVLFKTRQLFLSLSEHDGSRFAVTTVLGERRAEGVRWLFSSAAGSAKEENLDEPALEAIIISASSGQSGFSSSSGDSQKVRAYGPIQGLPWGLSVAMGKRDLYAPVWRDSTILGLVLVALLLLGGLLLLLVQRPFARRVIDQAKALDWEIEERRRAERDLAEKTRLLEATLENIDQGISAVDANLIVVAFNKRFLELLDLPAERFQPGTRRG